MIEAAQKIKEEAGQSAANSAAPEAAPEMVGMLRGIQADHWFNTSDASTPLASAM